jgi:hypothetical protein
MVSAVHNEEILYTSDVVKEQTISIEYTTDNNATHQSSNVGLLSIEVRRQRRKA